MGVRGLTTYISSNSHLYLSPYQLHNSTLIIDGNNVASQLYVWVSKSNSAFGGDYDRYYKCVRDFFELLKQCKVTPLVIFDGGYETRKLGTVWLRLQNKLVACRKVNPNNQLRRSVFPLLMRDTFRDILIELGISFAQCDFEADEEIATLARELQCPVLSYDSDFYVYDVLYIPFNSFQLSASASKPSTTKETYSYIGCEIYKVDRFLQTFGGLQREMLPLMATLLGNDYIKRSLFDGFYAQIRMPKRRKSWSDQHRRIAGLLDWLRKENVSSAIPKILSHLKQRDRDNVARQMKRAIAAYDHTTSKIKQYLRVPERSDEAVLAASPEVPAPAEDSSEEEGESGGPEAMEEQGEDSEASEEGSSGSEETEGVGELAGEEVEDEAPGHLPASFLQRYRQGLLPACFMDLLTKTRFYILQPQKEDYNEAESSHAASLPILRHLVTLLLGPEDASRVSVITRRHVTPARRRLFIGDLTPEPNLPSLASIPSLSLEKRLSLLLQPTGVNFPLQCLPEEWRLFFLALAYWASHTSHPPVSDKHVHAAVLGVVMLALVRPSKKERLERAVQLKASAGVPTPGAPDIKNALGNVKSSDCAVLYSTIYVPHSYAESKNHKSSYDLSVVHSFAQLQSALMCLSQLNQLLGMPLKSAPLHRLFSGTLMYNLYRALQPRSDVEAYLSSSLSHAPSLLLLHRALSGLLLQHLAPSTPRCVPHRRPRPRRKRKREVSEGSGQDEASRRKESDSDSGLVDPSNRFALLATN